MKDKKQIKYDVAVYFPDGALHMSFECDLYIHKNGFTHFYTCANDSTDFEDFMDEIPSYQGERNLLYSFSNSWLIKIEER